MMLLPLENETFPDQQEEPPNIHAVSSTFSSDTDDSENEALPWPSF